ncbi:MFS transporter [Haloglomus salinum]|uniref:MFS transporter n=1 Tax=Haloglomus salinum TaxID=2962673 RepID=UPI0020C986F0|nr:MFS transporter [Haloglomus salinum]
MPVPDSDAAADDAGTDADGNAGISWRSPALLAILAATLLTPTDVPLISPALPRVQAAFGIPESSAGLLVTLYALPGIVLAPVVGALADRVGRREVLTGCLVLFGLTGTAVAFTDAFAVALGLRVLQGAAAGSLFAALAMTVVGDRYEGARHDAVMGVTSAALSLGTAVYPLVGGYLAERAWNAPFLVYALALPVAALVWVALDGGSAGASTTRESASAEGGYVREALRAVPTRRALALYGVMFVSFALLFGGLYTAVPFYLDAAFGLSPTAVGLVTSAVLLVTAVVSMGNGHLASRASRTELLAAGFACYAVSFLGVALAGTLPLLAGALLVFGAGNGLVTPTLFAGVSSLAPDRVRGGVMSLQTTTIGVSQAVGPLAFTLLAGAVGDRTAILGAAGVAAVALVALSILPLAPRGTGPVAESA